MKKISIFLIFLLVSVIGTAQTITTTFANNNGSSVVVFSIENSSATNAYLITDIGSVAGFTGTGTARLYAKPATFGVAPGAAGAITAANGWTDIGANTALATTSNTTTNAPTTWISGMSYIIPPLTQVRFCLQHVSAGGAASFSTAGGSLRYSTVGTQTCSFLNGDLTLNACTNYAYGGTMGSPTNAPRGFLGFVNYTLAAPCAGTPAPGNTISTAASVCANAPFTLSLQNPTSGTGVTYQWESADDLAFTSNVVSLGTSSTQSASQTTDKYYRCNVTCSTGPASGTSTPVLVTMNTFINCYCNTGLTTSGGAGDIITNVTMGGINNTTSGAAPWYVAFNNTPEPIMQASIVPISITFGTDGTQHSAIWIDFDQNGTFDASENLALSTVAAAGSSTVTYNLVIPSSGPIGLTRMRVRGGGDGAYTAAGACIGQAWGETEDYLVDIQANVLCSGTPNPGATISSQTSVCVGTPINLSVTNSTSGSGVSYVWESADDAAFTVNVATLASTLPTATVASQSSAKYYRCQVTCSNGPVTGISTPVLVAQNAATACYCTPSYTSGIVDGDLISNVAITGTTLSNNTGTATSPNISYTFYGPPTYTASNYTATLIAGNTYNVVVTIGSFSGQGLKAWIDYNDNGVFETTEVIGNTTSTISTAFGTGTFPITIACNPPTGTHRMRIREVWNNAGPSIDPCASYGWGETEDYLITIDPPLPCPAPSALVASNPTATTVDLNWIIGCSETAWNVEYGPVGFTPGTGTTVAVTTNPATISGLVCETAHDFYVYANCGGAGASLPSLVASATTGICPCTGTPTPGNTIVAGTACTAGSTINLSLQNATTGSSVTYQWQSADDAAFTTNVLNLGTGATQVGTVNGPTYFRCQVTCATGPSSAFSTPVLVDISTVGTGNTLADPIIIGAAPCSATPYTNTVNNGACFTDNLVGSQASPDVFYQFTLAAPATVQAGLCGSGFDTYIHLLDNTGAILQSNDDNGPLCTGTASSLSATLAAGTYYIVTEGYTSNLGNLSLTLNTTDPCSASMNITAFVEGYYITGSSPAAMAAASYDNLVNSGSATPGNATDVCLVTVELWPDALGSTYSATGMLNTDGSLSVTFPSAALGGTYWVALTSPNTLRTFSASSITLASTSSYDFSSSLASAATDGSADPLATLAAGLFGLRSGDINQDEFIDGTDYAVFEGDVVNSANGAFSLPSDLNGDSFVDGTDYPILDVNSASGFYSQYPAFL